MMTKKYSSLKKYYIVLYMSSSRHHYCEICEKNYSSRQSLYRHNKRFHDDTSEISTKSPHFAKKTGKISTKSPHFDKNLHKISTLKKYECQYCSKELSRSDSLKRHEKKCETSQNNIKDKYEKLKQDLLNVMNKNYKIHPKRLKRLCRENNIVLDNTINNSISNSTVNSHNTTNNITNNFIVQLGSENVVETLTKKEQLYVLNSGYGSINELVKKIHYNDKYPQFQNIAITNIHNKYAYKYDKKQGKMIVVTKEKLLEDVLEMRTINLEEIYDEFGHHINDKKRKIILDIINKISDDENFDKDFFNSKKEEIKIFMYNNKSEEIE